LSTFIETGTYLGKTISFVKNYFEKVITIELDEDLYNKAKKLFQEDNRITVLNGDSGKLLEKELISLKEPALFWIDGHFSGGITAKSELETPILSELNAIVKHNVKGHLILIDDMRLFTGENDYPTIIELKNLLKSFRLNFKTYNRYDFIIVFS